MVHKVDLSCQWLAAERIPLANKFYKTEGVRGKARRLEPCAVLINSGGSLIACAYLRQYQDYQLLSGVAVAQDSRGQGLAKKLIAFMSNRFDRETYSYPLVSLERLYHQCGFERCQTDDLPEEAAIQFNNYQLQGRKIIAMRFASPV